MKRILLIEDDTVMRENTTEILELAHYHVASAPNGKKGCALAREWKPDLIICDIMMPELDGYGVLHVLSKDPLTASVPFIFLTAKAEKSEMRRGMELGADDYLTKPFEETELLNAIETRLRKAEALRKEFSRDSEGLHAFLDEARGAKVLEGLTRDRPVSRYRKKETIYRSGDAPHCLFFLATGQVKTTQVHDDGKELITNVYRAGDFFGHITLFEGRDYVDSAVALEDCEVHKIPKDDFLALVSRHREVAARFIKLLSNQIEEQEKQLLHLAYDTVRKKTAEALLRLYRQSGGSGGALALKVTRDDLANLAGIATETVIRCLSEFKDDEFIEINGREITVLDAQALEEMP